MNKENENYSIEKMYLKEFHLFSILNAQSRRILWKTLPFAEQNLKT